MEQLEDGPPAADGPPYVIRFTQSFDTAVEAGKFVQARLLQTYYLLFGAGIAIGALASVLDLYWGFFVLLFSGLMLLMARFYVWDRLFGRRRVRSLLDHPIELDIDSDGVVWHGPTGTSHIPWSSLTDVRTNERTVIFVRDRVLVAYAPTSAFASAAELANVVAFSRDRIGSADASRA